MKKLRPPPFGKTRTGNPNHVRESIYLPPSAQFRDCKPLRLQVRGRRSQIFFEGLYAVRLLPMKALVISRFGEPEVLEVREVADPAPAPGQDLVQVEAGGINFADIMTARGGYPGAPK